MQRFNLSAGRFAALVMLATAALAAGQGSHAQEPGDLGYLLVPSFDDNRVYRYDAATGAFVDVFVPRRSGGMVEPWACIFSPWDGSLVVGAGHFVSGQFIGALRFDGETGAFINQFTPQLIEVHGITFGPDGDLYIGQRLEPGVGAISRFDGLTGEYRGDFVPAGSGGIVHPVAHVFGPGGRGGKRLDLYVAERSSASILRYDGETGEFLGAFVASGSGGLEFPLGLVFGPDGDLYVADGGATAPAVLRFEGPASRSPGAFLGEFVPPGSGGLLQPWALLFGPDANGDGCQDLYVTSCLVNPHSYITEQGTSSVKLYDGVDGDYIADFVPVDANGGLAGPGLMTFSLTDPVTLQYLGD